MRKEFKKWLFITNHLKSKNTSVVKKILLGVPNEALLLRITKVHLNIKRSLHSQTFSNCQLFFDTPCRGESCNVSDISVKFITSYQMTSCSKCWEKQYDHKMLTACRQTCFKFTVRVRNKHCEHNLLTACEHIYNNFLADL